MRYKPQTIEEQGGLKKWLLKSNINYELFKMLRGLEGQNYTTIARALTSDRRVRSGKGSKINSKTVKHWFTIDDEEIEKLRRKT